MVTFILLAFMLAADASERPRTEILKTEENVRDADLIFVVEQSAASEDGMSGAIIDATATGSGCATHVGIITVQADSVFVIDAAPRTGVSMRHLENFVQECASSPGTRIVIMRVVYPIDSDAVISKAKSLSGKEYDFAFLPDNDSWYCSEFVQTCFTDGSTKSVFDSHPMSFKDAEGNYPEYWQKLFSNLGMPIPEGVPGTNPDEMMKSDKLSFVAAVKQSCDN